MWPRMIAVVLELLITAYMLKHMISSGFDRQFLLLAIGLAAAIWQIESGLSSFRKIKESDEFDSRQIQKSPLTVLVAVVLNALAIYWAYLGIRYFYSAEYLRGMMNCFMAALVIFVTVKSFRSRNVSDS